MIRRPSRPLRPSAFRSLSEVKLTPLVDVMLVLLVVLMVTAPMFASGIKVNLPPKEPIVVAVTRD